MGDFFQNGPVASLHQGGKVDLEKIEARISEFTKYKHVSLILPCLYSEIKSEAVKRTIEHLKGAGYLRRVVIGLDRVSEDEFKKARELFSVLPQETKVIWNNGPGLETIYSRLWTEGLLDVSAGRGRSVWTCTGYLLALKDTDVIAYHGCDILTYDRTLLARLIYPLLDPNMDYEFVKGFYNRGSDLMYGRLHNLFIAPFIQALKAVLGNVAYLEYLDSFRYPLSSEYAMSVALAKANRVPSNWGFEIGLLAEVYRNCTTRRICQVDLAVDYERMNQEISQKDPFKGMLKMCIDITTTVLHALASEGTPLSEGIFRTLKVSYSRFSQEMLKLYENDAAINGLEFQRYVEKSSVENFTKGLEIACQAFLKEPLETEFMPNWSGVAAAIPSIGADLIDVINSDNT